MRLRHYLYNAFLIEHEGVKIAIDPGVHLGLLKLRSLIPKEEWVGTTHVLVTHGDPDHFVYAVPISKTSGAAVVCGDALMEDFVSGNVDDVQPISAGGTVSFEALSVEGLNAKHGPLPVKFLGGIVDVRNEVASGKRGGKRVYLGSAMVIESLGEMDVYSRGIIKLFFGLVRLEKENVDFARGSVGFKITMGGKSIVNLGDTVIQEGWEGLKPDLLMIPIGGRVARNTMDEKEALEAVRLIEPKIVVPCHYNCDFLWKRKFNPADDEMFKREVEQMRIACHIMHCGDEIQF